MCIYTYCSGYIVMHILPEGSKLLPVLRSSHSQVSPEEPEPQDEVPRMPVVNGQGVRPYKGKLAFYPQGEFIPVSSN